MHVPERLLTLAVIALQTLNSSPDLKQHRFAFHFALLPVQDVYKVKCSRRSYTVASRGPRRLVCLLGNSGIIQ